MNSLDFCFDPESLNFQSFLDFLDSLDLPLFWLYDSLTSNKISEKSMVPDLWNIHAMGCPINSRTEWVNVDLIFMYGEERKNITCKTQFYCCKPKFKLVSHKKFCLIRTKQDFTAEIVYTSMLVQITQKN